MKNDNRHFSLFTLFVLTTAAAAAFAIIRLPLPLIGKMLICQTVAFCFLGWAVRNRKYPDPRVQQEQTPRRFCPDLKKGLASRRFASQN